MKRGKSSLPSLSAATALELAQIVQRSTGGERGLSNRTVLKLARLLGCSLDFKGVFAADCIPVKYSQFPRFTMIINLGTWKDRWTKGNPVGHFVTVSAEAGSVKYVDPYGLPCTQRHVLKFLKHCNRSVEYNDRQIQSLTSRACGLYALLFALYLDDGSFTFKMKFGRIRLANNDAKCMVYLRRIIAARGWG